MNYGIYDKLDHIEQQLAAYGFLRIHKSFLVNMKHIRKISNYAVLMDWGETLPVPRLRFQAVREAFVAYKGSDVMGQVIRCIILSLMVGICVKFTLR